MQYIEKALRNANKANIPSSTFEKVDNVLRNLEHRKGTLNMKPRIRKSAVIAAVVAVMLLITTTAFAIATDGFKFFFDSFAESAQQSNRVNENKDAYNAGILIKDYTLAFSNMDEIRDLFNINIGNQYMDISLGNPYENAKLPDKGFVSVSDFGDGVNNVRIATRFIVEGCILNAEILVPLYMDDKWGVAYADYHGADPTTRYLYENNNGITAHVVLEERDLPEWTLDLRFVYDGAYYIVESDNTLQTSDGQIDVKAIVAAFIDAFKDTGWRESEGIPGVSPSPTDG